MQLDKAFFESFAKTSLKSESLLAPQTERTMDGRKEDNFFSQDALPVEFLCVKIHYIPLPVIPIQIHVGRGQFYLNSNL